MEKTWATLYHTGELVDILVGCFCRTSDTHVYEPDPLTPFHSPSPMSCLWCMNLRSWLCEASGAWISFSCGWQPTEIRTVDRHCKTRSDVSTNERLWLQTSITKFHQKVPVGLPGLSSLSPTWYIFFLLTRGGAQIIFFKWFSCFFQVVTMQNSKSSVFCSFYSGFFRAELRYPVLWCSIVISGLKPCSRLLQILIFWLFTSIYYYLS